MPPLKTRAILVIAAAIAILFGAVELYGLSVVGDWTILNPTVSCQLLAITIAVAPMTYGLIYASHHQED
jgi:hypothetical protein